MSSDLLNKYAKNLEFRSWIPIEFNENSSGRFEVWDQQSQRWEMTYDSIDISGHQDQRAMFAFLNSLRNGVNFFDWELPLHSDPVGTAGINPLVNPVASGSYTVSVIVSNPNDDFLYPGDIIRFSNHNKVYQVNRMIGNVVTLNTPLQKPLKGDEQMITRNVTVRTMLKPGTEPVIYNREAGDLDASFSAEFVEKL